MTAGMAVSHTNVFLVSGSWSQGELRRWCSATSVIIISKATTSRGLTSMWSGCCSRSRWRVTSREGRR